MYALESLIFALLVLKSTEIRCGRSSVGRALSRQGRGHGFESQRSLSLSISRVDNKAPHMESAYNARKCLNDTAWAIYGAMIGGLLLTNLELLGVGLTD